MTRPSSISAGRLVTRPIRKPMSLPRQFIAARPVCAAYQAASAAMSRGCRVLAIAFMGAAARVPAR
jgi:hypothetical protein